MKRSITGWKLVLWAWILLPAVIMAQPATGQKILSAEKLTGQKGIPVRTDQLKPSEPVRKANRMLPKAAASGMVTMEDLLGQWIVQSKTLVPARLPDVGNSVTITRVDSKTILIKNFWDAGLEVKATVNFADKTISIPYQKVFTHKTYGDCDIRWITVVNGQVQGSKTKGITGTISSEGIELTDSWGIYVTSGEYADNAFGVYEGTSFLRGNATMSADDLDNSHTEYPVLITQKSENLLSVLNFANYGRTIEIALNEDKSFSIASQLAYRTNSNEDYYTYSANWKDQTIYAVISGSGDEHTLNWGAWLIQSEKYYIGNHVNGKITTNLTLIYPKLTVDKFEGEGTESNPYLIKGKDELILLARKVNTDKELKYGDVNKHTKSFLGKFFKVANDIDLASLRLDPIGNAWSQCFAGTFDGNGKSITGLSISVSGGLGGLFGRVDTAGVIKNVNLKDVDIKAYGRWTGGIAGWCLGTIRNCHVTGTVQNQDKETGGIAGKVTTLTECSFSGTVIGLNGCVGGIAGQADGAVSKSFCDATVIATSNSSAVESCGGIVGALYLEGASVSNCYFAGTVTTSGANPLYLGGIVGDCYKGSISQCYNVGTVAGSGSQGATGGIAGYFIGTIADCYNSGRVAQSACKSVGGIAGGVSDNRNIMTGELIAHSSIKNCYTVGTVVAETGAYNPETETRETIGSIQQTASPVFENIYYDKQMIDFGSQKYGVTTGKLTSAQGPHGFSAGSWIFAEGFYPRLKGMETGAVADLSVAAMHLDETTPDNVYKITKDFVLKLAGNCQAGFYLDDGTGKGTIHSKGHAASLQDGINVQLTGNGKDTLFIVNGTYSRSYIITATSSSIFEGEGIQASPYLIKSKADLIKLSELTSSEVKQAFRDTYFRMTNDIDLEYDEAFKGINVDPKDANHQFAGHFDGGGFTIHRMKLTGIKWKTTPEDAPDGWGIPDNTGSSGYLGFIGRLAGTGSIRNLNLADDCKLEFWALSGAFVGSNYGGSIENCRNYADVTAYSGTVAGICATNDRLGAGTIRNCYNAGNIRAGYNGAGGIVGVNAGSVENCQNDGSVTVEKLSTFQATFDHAVAGGIVGTMNASEVTALRNNLNTGMITAKRRIGGICGSISLNGTNANVTIANNLNYGSVAASEVITRGGFSGEFSANCIYTLTGNYYDGQILPYGASGNASMKGIEGVSTSVLTKAAVGNFSPEIWDMAAGRYPVLKAFANEEKAKIASRILIGITPGENSGNLKSDLTLSAPQGVNWSLKQGNAFTIDGSVVKVPVSVEKVTCDTLTAISPRLKKTVILVKLPAVPLSGQGTADAPYLIKSAEEWNSLAGYMAVTYQNMEGVNLKIADNIDFNGKTFVPMAGDGITSFEGILDGNRKSLDNIDYKDETLGTRGIFGRIGVKGAVSDLIVGSGIISSTKTRVGGLCGKVAGTLKNCVNKANVTTTGNYAGGIAALVEATGKLIGCINYGEVNAQTGFAGGITAECEAGASFTACGNEGKLTGSTTIGGIAAKANRAVFDECYNKGMAEASKATAGGIIGIATGKDTITIKNSYNTADIVSTNNAGGIVATAGSTPFVIDNCYNTGSITTSISASGSGTGGLIGVLAPASTIVNSYNGGSVTAEKCAYTGGIAGNISAATKEETRIYIRKCYNEGDISALGNFGGGICGNTAAYMTIDSCYNLGNVEGTYYIGGISSNLGGEQCSITNCWNNGAVTAQKNAAGGLFGTGNYGAEIRNCFNTGTISSIGADEKEACQIGGLAGMSKAKFTNCYNNGRIDGKKQIGGLVGQAFNGSLDKNSGAIIYGTCFDHCYNTGEVTRLDTLSGNIVGDVSGKAWQYNIAKELYMLTPEPVEGDSIAKPISSVDLAKLDLGEGWTGDDYTYPLLETCSSQYTQILAAIVVFTGEDMLTNVTQDFHVGTPGDLVWSSSSASITFDGNNASVKSDTKEQLMLTATVGDLTKDIQITLNTPPSGIGSVTGNKVLVKEEFYSLSGIRLLKEQLEQGNYYISVKTYEDGTTENVKEKQ